MSKETLIVLYGGRSAEREVSVLSAESVVRAVNYDKYIVKTFFISDRGQFAKTQEYTATPAEDDRLMTNSTFDEAAVVSPASIYEAGAIVFPVLHGPMGEDGSIQGFIEILGMAYVGPTVMHAAVTMDKIMTKHVLENVGVPQTPYVAIEDATDVEAKIAEINEKLPYPVFVKPANMGSSVGISKVDRPEDLQAALDEGFKWDTRLLIEKGVNAREIEVAVLGNADVNSTDPGEVVKDVAFYDYNSKYIDNKIEMQIPAKVDADVMTVMRRNAEKAYRAVGGRGMSRVDFFLTDQGEIFLNEINAIPGFTQFSMYPLLWENMGLNYADLIDTLIALAKEAFETRESHLN
jgi:D-alanine-D-alanine ligase